MSEYRQHIPCETTELHLSQSTCSGESYTDESFCFSLFSTTRFPALLISKPQRAQSVEQDAESTSEILLIFKGIVSVPKDGVGHIHCRSRIGTRNHQRRSRCSEKLAANACVIFCQPKQRKPNSSHVRDPPSCTRIAPV